MSRRWRRGDVCWCELDKARPVVLLTRDDVIDHLNNVTVAPLTTRVRNIASHVVLETFDGVPQRCAVNLDNIQTVPKSDLTDFITSLTPFRMKQVCEAATFALQLESEG